MEISRKKSGDRIKKRERRERLKMRQRGGWGEREKKKELRREGGGPMRKSPRDEERTIHMDKK